MQTAPPGDPMAVLIWTAVPVEYCTSEMQAFRKTADPMRADDNATWGYEGLPRSDHPEHRTIRHWQRGGVVLFGYASAQAATHAKELLGNIYIARSGRVAVREPM